MSITFCCPACNKSLTAPDGAAGRNARCAKCGASFAVPQQSESKPATRQCPFCAEEILVAAKKCKHCHEMLGDQALVASSEASEPDAPDDSGGNSPAPESAAVPNGRQPSFKLDPKRISFDQAILAVALFIPVFSGIVWWFLQQESASAPPFNPYAAQEQLETERDAVIRVAQDFVRDRLRSPSTAQFSLPSECRYSEHAGECTVSGYVDAQNDFGAVIRRRWTVVMEKHGTDCRLKDFAISQ